MTSKPFLKLPPGSELFQNGVSPFEAQTDFHSRLDIRKRLAELKLLVDGWLDGKGIAPSSEGIDWLADTFDSYYPDSLAMPFLFPTPEGQILAEWSLRPWSPSIEINLVQKTGYWHVLNLKTDEEVDKQLDLTKSSSWIWLGQQIRTMGGESE
jgi:hypothetical protein